MAGHTILLNLIGGVALLLWGTRMVQEAILKAFGAELRGAIAGAAGSPLRAAATGAVAATALQSATATAILVTGFAASGLIALPAALAVMLGADLGTTLAVQALSVDVGALMPLLLVAGVALARLAERPRIAEVGPAARRPRPDPAGAAARRRRLGADARQRGHRARARAPRA